MALLGTYDHTVDDKGRMSLPARFRLELDGRVFLCKGLTPKATPCLQMFPPEEWDAYMRKIETLSDADPRGQQLKMFILGGATECDVDKQGRILVPPKLRAFARLDKEVTVVGASRFAWLWNAGVYGQVEAAIDQDDVAAFAAGHGL